MWIYKLGFVLIPQIPDILYVCMYVHIHSYYWSVTQSGLLYIKYRLCQHSCVNNYSKVNSLLFHVYCTCAIQSLNVVFAESIPLPCSSVSMSLYTHGTCINSTIAHFGCLCCCFPCCLTRWKFKSHPFKIRRNGIVVGWSCWLTHC